MLRENIVVLSPQLGHFEVKALENPTRETKQAIYRMGKNMALNVFMKRVSVEYKNKLIAIGPKNLNEKCLTLEISINNKSNNVGRSCLGFSQNNQHANCRNYSNNLIMAEYYTVFSC